MDLTEVYSRQHRSQTGSCQSSSHLGKRKRDAEDCRVLNPAYSTLTGKPSALATDGSTSQFAGSARLISRALGAGGKSEIQCPSRQAQDHVYREFVRPKFHNEKGTSHHQWTFGAIAELLDNAVDEIPHGATKVWIDSVTNPCDGSPSLLVQDDGGGMDPISLRKCMTAACTIRKTPDSIGQNGTGFRAGISYLGASAIVFSRHVHTSTPTQSIGCVAHNAHLANQIEIPMVHYGYDPVRGETIGYEHKPGQFSINLSMLLRLSPYNSEKELLQNFNDIGPHGTKIIVFNLLRSTEGHLDLDFNTDTKDIRISVPPTVHLENEAAGDQSNLVYQYRRSLRAYASILYLGLPNHFSIILRGEEVKRRNLVTELKHSQCIKYKRSMAERDDEVVLGFLDGVVDVGNDRFCFYYQGRLILPFIPSLRFSNRDRSIVGIVQANYLKPARNKQDFLWSQELKALLKVLKDVTTEFWKNLGNELKDATSRQRLAPPISHDEANLKGSEFTWTWMQALTLGPSFSGMPVPRALTPCLPLFSTASTRDKQQTLTAIATSSDQGTSSNGIPARPTTLPFGWNGGGLSSHGIQRAPAPQPLTSAMASLAGDSQPIIPVMASTNDYGLNFKGSSTSVAPRAIQASAFTQLKRGGMGFNGIMRAPAPHLVACYMPATARERHRSTLATQDAMVNTIGGLAPSHSGPARAMVALHDLPIKIEPENDDPVTYGNNAIHLAVGVMDTAAAASAASSATSIREPDVMGIGDCKASVFYPWCPPGFNPDNGSPNSSRQAQELQDGSNQEEQEAKPQLNLLKP